MISCNGSDSAYKPIQNGLKPSRYAPTFNIRDNEKKTLTKQ